MSSARVLNPRFWKARLPLLRSPAGWAAIPGTVQRMLWPSIKAPAAAYRRVVVPGTRLVTIVGSLGKTTTTRAVAAALGIPPRRISRHNAFAAVALAALRIRPWHPHAVIEVGIAMPGQMATYREMLRPDVVVVTSIASDHNRSLRTLEATRAEKSEMLRALGPAHLAILNGDDPHVRWMRATTAARIVTFGVDEGNHVRATEVALAWPHGTTFRVHARGESALVRTRLVGPIAVYPILAAIAVGLEEGRTFAHMLPALAAVEPTFQRLQPVATPTGATILRDDYKSALESVESALDAFETMPARRKIVVLGDVEQCPGKRRDHYRRLGERVGRIASQAIFLGSDCQAYGVGAVKGGLSRAAITRADDDLTAALAALPSDLGEGDAVLVKGRTRQRLARVVLALLGRDVRCRVALCPVGHMECDTCPMLERGWRPGEAEAWQR
jgi:UDP-N-acetylmuramyl pentapeptide synthase